MSKGWTKERREKQAENIKKHKPWEKSTGSKTAKGKINSSMNAYKHGMRSKKMEDIHRMFALNREFLHLSRVIFLNQTDGLFDSNEVKKYLTKSKTYFDKQENERTN